MSNHARIPDEREFSPFAQDDGSVDRPVVGERWLVPAAIELRAGYQLVSRSTDGHGRQAIAEPGPRMLTEFLRLGQESSPSERVVEYARRWGTLHICKHGLPASHTRNPEEWCEAWSFPDELEPEAEFWEPVGVWRHFARQARGYLAIADRLHGGQIGRQEDWQIVHEWRHWPNGRGSGKGLWAFSDRPTNPSQTIDLGTGKLKDPHQAYTVPWWRQTVDEDWSMVVEGVEETWLSYGDVRPSLSLSDGTPRIRLGGGGLFGALAVQLMMNVCRTAGIALCSECGIAYLPKRRPRVGNRHYCQDCGKKPAQRNASREYRRRRRTPS